MPAERAPVPWLLLGLGGWLIGGESLAQTSLHGTGQAAVAYSDNALGAPDLDASGEPAPGERAPIRTTYFLLTPGLALIHEGPASELLTTYQRSYVFYLEAPDENLSTDTLAFLARLQPSERDLVTLSLSTQVTSVSLLNRSAGQSGSTTADGGDDILSIDFRETWERELSPRWSSLHGSGMGFIVPLEGQNTEPMRYSLNLDQGVEYARELDAHALLASAAFFDAQYMKMRPPGGPTDFDQALATLVYRVRRDLSLSWAIEASGGVSALFDLEGRFAAGLVGSAGIGYSSLGYDVTLQASHTPEIDLITNGVIERSQLSLSANVTLSEDARLYWSGSAAGGQDRFTDFDVVANGEKVNVVSGSTSLSYTPDWFSMVLSYEHFRQFDAPEDSVVLRDLTSNTVMLSLSGMLPPRRTDPVVVNRGMRVDRSDRKPLGLSTNAEGY